MCFYSSQQLLVVLHTAQYTRSVAATTMPSPAAKLKAARRLPKRLRLSGEEPQGDIARMREEATGRYVRGESSSSTLHSCLQRPRADRTDGNPNWWAESTWTWNAGWDPTWHGAIDWQHSAQAAESAAYEQDTEASSWYWTSPRTLEAARTNSPDRPLPPKPPTPRRQRPAQVWRAKAGELDKEAEGKSLQASSPTLGVDMLRPQSSSNRKRGHQTESPIPEDRGGAATASAAGEVLVHSAAHGEKDPTAVHEVATPDQVGKRSSAPDSDSEELVPVEPDQEMEASQVGKRCSVPSSDSEELVPTASSRDVVKRPGEEKASNSPRRSRTPACAAGHPRPWTHQDTDLSKALSRVLRHRSNLHRDEAGYAKLADVLVHPLIRRHRPTMEWIVYIVKANDKQRYALDEAGTRIRAVQGHSIPVDSSKLLRQLETGDIGDMVPTCALHSTYFSLTWRHPRHLLPQTHSPCHEP